MSNSDFAHMMRELQRPRECRKSSKDCWVKEGSKSASGSASGNGNGSLRCLICLGKVRLLPMDKFQREYATWLRERLHQEAAQ